MADKPAWRVVYDQVAGELGPRLTDVTGSDGFAEAVEVAEAVRARAASELQRSSRRFLHAWNLPAGTDVAMLRQEVGALNRELRALARRVEDLQGELDRVAAATAPPSTPDAPERVTDEPQATVAVPEGETSTRQAS